MKLRLEELNDEFRCYLKDASMRYAFRMGDSNVFNIVKQSGAHFVTLLNDSTDPAVIDTSIDTIVAWLENNETVILIDNIANISAVLFLDNGMICGDGVNMNTCIMRRYTAGLLGSVGMHVMTNGPMTDEEILHAVLVGWGIQS